MRGLRLYIKFIRKIFKSRFMYLGDFVISFVLNLISNLYSFIFIGIIFSNVTALGEWTFYEILLIYGINSICRGIFCTFFGELDLLSDEYILDGKLDNILLRPVSPIFLLLSSNIYEENLTDIFLGILYLIFCFGNIGGLCNAKSLLILLAGIIVGVIMYFAFFLLLSSLSFWFNSRFSLLWSFLDVTEYSNYPLDIFSKSIRNILTWIVPFGLVSFYPSLIILGKMPELHWIGYCAPLVAVAFLLLALCTWKRGLGKYESIS